MRLARRGLRAVEILAFVSLAAGVIVWWLIAGREGPATPVELALAAVIAAALLLPGLLLVHLARTLYRTAALVDELREQIAGAAGPGEAWTGDGRLLARTLRLALRERGAGMIAAPWYWLLSLWAAAASLVLILGAVSLGLAALL
ncbi:MAG: hypothetical protein F4X25_02120 [Chloroflexi bacterium]|nr:hypothetical protein [Chloroflexota bacterium]